LKTCQRSLVDELDTSEDLLAFVTNVQHDQVIGTQNSVVTQVLKYVHICVFDYMLTNNFISFMLSIRKICFRPLGIHSHQVLFKEISYTCRKYLIF